jgi:DNA-directed RNA polymerase specialized sigma24 family protein
MGLAGCQIGEDGFAQVEAGPRSARQRATIADLYTREREGLYRYLVSSGVEPAQAQDVTQEAFLRLYAALRDGASIHSLKGWVYRVAHNLAVDSLLRDRRHRAISNAVASALATLENTRDLTTGLGWRMLTAPLARRQHACSSCGREVVFEIAAVLKIRTPR